jgi:uncharacterized protein YecT (DUF1311 family)
VILVMAAAAAAQDLKSQKAWLAYRAAQCALATYANAGGRELHIYQLGCQTLLTNERAKQLKQFNEDH